MLLIKLIVFIISYSWFLSLLKLHSTRQVLVEGSNQGGQNWLATGGWSKQPEAQCWGSSAQCRFFGGAGLCCLQKYSGTVLCRRVKARGYFGEATSSFS